MSKFFFIITLFVCDFLSKQFIFNFIDLNTFINILPILDLAHIHNYGIAFGLFSGIVPKFIIISISCIIVFIIIYMMVKTENMLEKWGFTLILAGAISNIVDRIINNYVLDFIYFHYKNFYWPAFNFADIYITFGILIVIWQYINIKKEKI